MIEIVLSEKLKKQIKKIQNKMTPYDTESAGPLFGRFDLDDGKQIMILDKFFDRTSHSTLAYSEFKFDSDYFIRKEIKRGNKYVGTLHTHPFMKAEPSTKDKETAKKIQKELGILQTAYIIVNEDEYFLWKETNEIN